MPQIRVLPEDLRNKIAAGEVVERPSSVVRELIENSIDAGSAKIEIEVLYGGRKLLRVSDDGCGMDREDALLSLQRHATSKLIDSDGLFEIRTMGFRGEALASIASVSRLTLSTGPRGHKEGVSIRAEGGRVLEVRAAALAGTSVEVRDIFFNTPARKKFLKKDSTELSRIIDTVTALALSHPSIAFTLRAEGKEAVGLPGAGGPRERILQIYGGEFLDGLLHAGHETDGFRMEALVSRPENLRSTKAHQFVFINGRPVREPSVSHAVSSAYGAPHPIFFVYLSVDPRRVDFNVHPAKREVRFEDKEAVYRAVRKGVMAALRASPSGSVHDIPERMPESAYASSGVTGEALRPAVFEAVPLAYEAGLQSIYLGDSFVAFSDGGGLTLLDHHAAHERILYEKFLKGIDLGSTRLLFPRQIKLSPSEHRAIVDNIGLLLEMGVEVEDFGSDSVLVRSLPASMMEADLRGVLSDVAGGLLEGPEAGVTAREKAAARMACHGSVRGRRILGGEALGALIRDLEGTERPHECPHGRPTRVSYSLDDLRKLFRRK